MRSTPIDPQVSEDVVVKRAAKMGLPPGLTRTSNIDGSVVIQTSVPTGEVAGLVASKWGIRASGVLSTFRFYEANVGAPDKPTMSTGGVSSASAAGNTDASQVSPQSVGTPSTITPIPYTTEHYRTQP